MTIKQEQANRANAAASTGPRTAQGRAKSCLNAISHGLSATSAVLPGEDPATFRQLEETLCSQYPHSMLAQVLCSQYASVIWRLARLRRLEVAALLLTSAGRFAHGLPAEGGEVLTEEDLFKNPPDEYGDHRRQKLEERLNMSLYRVTSHLNDFDRYEKRLFNQLLRLTSQLKGLQMREPTTAEVVAHALQVDTRDSALNQLLLGAVSPEPANQSQH